MIGKELALWENLALCFTGCLCHIYNNVQLVVTEKSFNRGSAEVTTFQFFSLATLARVKSGAIVEEQTGITVWQPFRAIVSAVVAVFFSL